MVPTLFFYQLVLIALVWLCLMCHWMWPSAPATCLPPPEPTPPVPKRKRERKPFAGLTTKPHCAACEHGTAPRPQAPSPPPPPHRAHTGAPSPGGHLHALLPQPRLCLSRLGGLGQSPCPWPSQWWSLAAAAVHRLSRLLSGDPRDDLPRQACGPGADRARHRVLGRGCGYPRQCAVKAACRNVVTPQGIQVPCEPLELSTTSHLVG